MTLAAGPRIVLPSGVCWNAVACRWSKTTSSGTPSTSCISRRMTSRSRSIAASSSLEFWRMSERMSTAAGTSPENTRA